MTALDRAVPAPRDPTDHGPWVDVHSHPGRCFLGGLDPHSPMVSVLGGDESAERVRSARAGGLAAVNASTVADLAVMGSREAGGLYAARNFEPGEAAADHRRQIDALAELCDADEIRTVLRADDIAGAADDDRPGVFLSCEGADFLEGSLAGLAVAFLDGVRAVTLVHYRINELGDIQTESSVHGGLTRFGREVVREMNRLGMIVDLAHATFEATVAALEESTSPIMISHSHLARRGAAHPRLLSARHARMVAEAGGIIGAWPAGIAMATLDDYADEICRLIDVVGVGHVAIGTDLDANYRPVLTAYTQFPELATMLAGRGLAPDEIDRVLGGNFIDLFGEVEARRA